MTSAMGLNWTVDDDKRLIEIDADGDVTRAEAELFFQDLIRLKVPGYRKLFDGRKADSKMGLEDLLAIGVMIRARHEQGGPLGPVAIVAQGEKFERFSRLLGILASSTKRPMLIFQQEAKARRWLMKQRAT
jgi:hypothetical protein